MHKTFLNPNYQNIDMKSMKTKKKNNQKKAKPLFTIYISVTL